jgi:tetratricopeptide (TPR) repeat protein
MQLKRRLYGASVIIALVFVSAPSVEADSKAKKPTKAQIQRARKAYNQGQKAFDSGNYREAKEAFQEAYDTVPNPVVLLSIAESLIHLKELEEAIAILERYLEERPDAADRAEVEKRIEEVKQTPALLAVMSDPSGADISVDGADTYKTTPAEIELAPGEHTIELSLNGRKPQKETVFARFGQRHELQIEFGDEVPVEPIAPNPLVGSADEASDDSGEGSSVVPWIVMGVGVAALATGTVLGVLALDEEQSYNDDPTESKADSGERLALFADVSFGVGLAAVVTGFVLLFTLDEEASQEESAVSAKRDASSTKLSVTPLFSDKQALISATVQF